MNTTYISMTDTAKLLRTALKEAFPGTKFSVRGKRYAGGSSMSVRWIDGPNCFQVEAITSQFAGSDFDGGQDLKVAQYNVVDGARVRFAPDYVFCSREVSDDMVARSIAAVGIKNMIPDFMRPTVAHFRNGTADHSNFAAIAWIRLVREDLARRTRCAGAKESATMARFAVALVAAGTMLSPEPFHVCNNDTMH